MTSAVHTFIVSLPIAKSDCYGQVSGTLESPACIHSEHKWTKFGTPQSFTVPAASEESHPTQAGKNRLCKTSTHTPQQNRKIPLARKNHLVPTNRECVHARRHPQHWGIAVVIRRKVQFLPQTPNIWFRKQCCLACKIPPQKSER